MKIQDDRCSMDVRVVRYQFPDRVPDKRETVDYDANWLTVSVRYTGPDFTAEFQDSCVLTLGDAGNGGSAEPPDRRRNTGFQGRFRGTLSADRSREGRG